MYMCLVVAVILNFHFIGCTSTVDQGNLGVEDVTHLPSN